MNYQVCTRPDIKTNLRIVTEPLNIIVELDNIIYNITVPKDFAYDGASIPKLLWPIFGTPYNCNSDTSACVHDYLYRKTSNMQVTCNNELITVNQNIADQIFRKLLCQNGVSSIKACFMYYGVKLFGKFFYKIY